MKCPSWVNDHNRLVSNVNNSENDELSFYRLTFGCNEAKKQSRTKLNQLNQITLEYQYNIYFENIYI